ncbi:G-type lectin S-receptor-like serine/threonine-protein kinase At1g11300 [Papaver somniferum]|uniref:G-type lectin S-receptor-like serine/threonine-protein kinase At1g11300 n=1 Tax=Papaver somniferum TaxID=3469 RepID=UPI000E6FF0AA|nr:G-type lectin S-receptor-like serine/threonine-protein kinase At1g11300 [Papaver somniferum]
MDLDTKKNSFFVLLYVFVLCSKALHSIAADTITVGGTLSGFETITSKDGRFMMGFFTPGQSRKYYLGIWYNYRTALVRTIVWVANRDKPLSGSSSSQLKLSENGNLVLHESESLIWSTYSASSTSNTTEAVLGDDGNLVLREKSNPSVVYWQSFDYPTDTWLPGAKIGINKKTNESRVLTSWRNQEDPAPGMFNLELDPTGIRQYLIKWNKSIEFWKSGEWNEQAKTFTLVPEMRLNYIFNFSFISNENESYFTYNLYNDSILSRLKMDISGQIMQVTWSRTSERLNLFWSQPKQLCDVYGICGPFGNCNQDTLKCECLPGFMERSLSDWNLQDSTGGCVRNPSLQCGSGSKDVFSPIPTSELPDDPQNRLVNSAEECKSACHSNCFCNAYAYGKNGCQLWEGDMLNTKTQSDGNAENLYLRGADTGIPSPEISPKRTKRKVEIWKIMIPVIAASMATLMGVLGYMYLCKRNKANERGRLKDLQGVLTDLLKNKATYKDMPNTNMLNDRKTEGETHELQIFDLVCLAIATNNFCLNNKLGEGGFGPVFKGQLQNRQQIAVKRLSKSSRQGIEEFKNEVELISKLQHRNLVKLLGCCIEGEENMLIYEYMPNKSLDAFLFDARNKASLDWDKRFNIIGGVARGLLYLHRDSRLRVIHRDLKVSNILLDEDMIPKISDFGMARIFGGNQTIDNTVRVVGTLGYMSPEYMVGGTFSEKSDVFSFGVLVLEVVSGKRNNSFYNPEQPLNLLLHAWRLWNEGIWAEIVDQDLGDVYSPFEVMKCIHIGLLCVQNRAVDRPTMAEVDVMLSSETDRPAPKEPPYMFPAPSGKPGIPPIPCSNNNVTLTMIGGR